MKKLNKIPQSKRYVNLPLFFKVLRQIFKVLLRFIANLFITKTRYFFFVSATVVIRKQVVNIASTKAVAWGTVLRTQFVTITMTIATLFRNLSAFLDTVVFDHKETELWTFILFCYLRWGQKSGNFLKHPKLSPNGGFFLLNCGPHVMMENCFETFRSGIQLHCGSKSTINQQQILSAAVSKNTC